MPDRDVKLTEKWNKIPVSSVTLNIASPLTVSLGEAPRKLTATINPSTVYPMPSVTYSSSNACVAIDANGNMTFKSVGSATITATVNDGSGKKATLVINVNQYTLTVNGSNAGGSSGAGKYNKGQTVTINAGTAAAGKKFVRWDKSANITLANANSATTTFVFPGADCNVTAVWADLPRYTVAFTTAGTGATGAGQYYEGQTVNIYSGTSGNFWSKWNVTAGSVTLANANSQRTSFVMPPRNVTIQAVWEAKRSVTISGGGTGASGAGTSYRTGNTVNINAGTKVGYKFNGWTVNPTNTSITNKTVAATSITVPAGNVTLTANWIPEVTVKIYNKVDGSTSTQICYPGETVRIEPGPVTSANENRFAKWELIDEPKDATWAKSFVNEFNLNITTYSHATIIPRYITAPDRISVGALWNY